MMIAQPNARSSHSLSAAKGKSIRLGGLCWSWRICEARFEFEVDFN
jgi:hypothetical protein